MKQSHSSKAWKGAASRSPRARQKQTVVKERSPPAGKLSTRKD